MKRTVFGFVLPLGWLVLAVAPFLYAWDRLPEPIASHWALSGAPNGALPRITVLAIHGGATALAGIIAWIVTRPGSRSRSVSATCGRTAFIGSLFAVLGIAVVAANLDAPSWRDARPMSLPLVGLLVAAAALAAAVVSRRARSLDAVAAAESPAERATVGLASGERATWIASAHNRWFGAIALALVGAAAAGRTLVPGWSALSCVAVAVVLAAFAEIHARVDDRGLSIAFGPWRLPRMRVPLERIRSARTIDIEPLANGGWGYRGSLSIFGRAAVIVRRGEGLELRLDRDQVLIVSVDDARTAAGLINDLAARR
jgi:hypothetical protein